MKNVLLFIFFIVVYGYADNPKFDNESYDKPEFDNDGDENTIARKEHSEAYEKIFEKTRFGAIGSSLWSFRDGGDFGAGIGGIAIIPLSKKGPFLFDIELNYIFIEKNTRDPTYSYYTPDPPELHIISIPLLLRFVIDGGLYPITLEVGTIYERKLFLETKFGDKIETEFENAIGLALGAGFIIKKFIIDLRFITYPTNFGGLNSRLAGDLGVGYLF